MESEFGGIGIQISTEDGQLRVVSPLYGTPAYRAGVQSGDLILDIDGKSTEGIDQDEAVERLKGKEGTEVTLTLVHAGHTLRDRMTVKLTRERVHVDTVLGDRRKADDTWDFMLDAKQGIGYVPLSAFSRETSDELRKALQELQDQHMRALVLDLRFNPGGLLNSAIEVCNLFISSGRIVSTKGRNTPPRVWDAHRDGAFEGFPMVILVNHYSASASEIVSACLQDHHRAVVVGERTWGKGSVQNVIPLDENRSALKLTTAAYFRPSGKNIHRSPESKESDQWGVMPDAGYALRLTDRETSSLMIDRQRRDVLHPHPAAEGKSAGSPGQSPKKRAAAATPSPTSSQAAPAVHPDADARQSSAAAPKGASGATQPISAPASGGASAPVPQPASDKPAVNPPRRILVTSSSERFVDRQLQMAVKYLTDELARAK